MSGRKFLISCELIRKTWIMGLDRSPSKKRSQQSQHLITPQSVGCSWSINATGMLNARQFVKDILTVFLVCNNDNYGKFMQEEIMKLCRILVLIWHIRNSVHFLPARRYASAGNSDRNVSVCPSVRLSRAGIVSKRRKLASWFLHYLVAPKF